VAVDIESTSIDVARSRCSGQRRDPVSLASDLTAATTDPLIEGEGRYSANCPVQKESASPLKMKSETLPASSFALMVYLKL
jgi:hypothetical protein